MALQTITLDLEVQGALDGSTFAPEVTLQGTPFGADNQIYSIIIPGNLGLIDPDYQNTTGSRGDRFLQRVEIRSPNVPSPAGLLAVVDARGILGPIVELERVADISDATYYRDMCVFVPQGAALMIDGFPADPGGAPHHVRLHFVGANKTEEEALLAGACCCDENFVADQAQVCIPFQITQLNPEDVGTANPAAVFSIVGGPFTATDVVEVFTLVGGALTNIVVSTLFVDSTEIVVVVDTQGASEGLASVFVFQGGNRACFATADLNIVGN